MGGTHIHVIDGPSAAQPAGGGDLSTTLCRFGRTHAHVILPPLMGAPSRACRHTARLGALGLRHRLSSLPPRSMCGGGARRAGHLRLAETPCSSQPTSSTRMLPTPPLAVAWRRRRGASAPRNGSSGTRAATAAGDAPLAGAAWLRAEHGLCLSTAPRPAAAPCYRPDACAARACMCCCT